MFLYWILSSFRGLNSFGTSPISYLNDNTWYNLWVGLINWTIEQWNKLNVSKTIICTYILEVALSNLLFYMTLIVDEMRNKNYNNNNIWLYNISQDQSRFLRKKINFIKPTSFLIKYNLLSTDWPILVVLYYFWIYLIKLSYY